MVNRSASKYGEKILRLAKKFVKTTVGLILSFWISSASMADEVADRDPTAAWQNRDLQPTNAAGAIGWNFGAFFEGYNSSE